MELSCFSFYSYLSSPPTTHSIVCKHSHFRLLLKKQQKRFESATTIKMSIFRHRTNSNIKSTILHKVWFLRKCGYVYE